MDLEINGVARRSWDIEGLTGVGLFMVIDLDLIDDSLSRVVKGQLIYKSVLL
jgi:hypothetical protein